MTRDRWTNTRSTVAAVMPVMHAVSACGEALEHFQRALMAYVPALRLLAAAIPRERRRRPRGRRPMTYRRVAVLLVIVMTAAMLCVPRIATAQTTPPTYDELAAQVAHLTLERDTAIAERDAALSDLDMWRAAALERLRLYADAVSDWTAVRQQLARERYRHRIYRQNVINIIRRLRGLPPVKWPRPWTSPINPRATHPWSVTQ